MSGGAFLRARWRRAVAMIPHAFLVLTLLPVMLAPPAFAEPVEFALEGLDGRLHRLSEHRGRWVVVNFWATWCGPCLEEIPELIAFHRQQGEAGAVVLGINFETIERDGLEAFVARWPIPYPILRVGETPVVPFEPLKGLPATFFVDPDGKLAASHLGPVTSAAIERFLARERGTAGALP